MIERLENVQEIALAVIVLCSLFYYWLLRKTKRERRLTYFESFMSIVAPVALLVLGVSFLI